MLSFQISKHTVTHHNQKYTTGKGITKTQQKEKSPKIDVHIQVSLAFQKVMLGHFVFNKRPMLVPVFC